MIENGFRLYKGYDGQLAIACIINGMVYELEPAAADGALPLGYYDTEFNLIAPDEVAKYDPDQPRAPKGSDEGGQWIEAGDYHPETFERAGPTVASNGYPQWEARLREVIAQLPAAHMKAILNTVVRVVDKLAPLNAAMTDHGYTLGLWSGNRGSNYGEIKIAKGFQFKGRNATLRNPDATLVHEIGHAIDYAFHNQPSRMLLAVASQDALKMTKVEKRQMTRASYWLQQPTEMFAELYSLAYTPGRQNKFFGMNRPNAEAKFKTSLAVLRNYLDRTIPS